MYIFTVPGECPLYKIVVPYQTLHLKFKLISTLMQPQAVVFEVAGRGPTNGKPERHREVETCGQPDGTREHYGASMHRNGSRGDLS